METERGSPACLLSENTEKHLSGFLQRLPSVARPLVSRRQFLEGLTNKPLASLPPYQWADLWLASAEGPGPGESWLSYQQERPQESDGPLARVPPRRWRS